MSKYVKARVSRTRSPPWTRPRTCGCSASRGARGSLGRVLARIGVVSIDDRRRALACSATATASMMRSGAVTAARACHRAYVTLQLADATPRPVAMGKAKLLSTARAGKGRREECGAREIRGDRGQSRVLMVAEAVHFREPVLVVHGGAPGLRARGRCGCREARGRRGGDQKLAPHGAGWAARIAVVQMLEGRCPSGDTARGGVGGGRGALMSRSKR